MDIFELFSTSTERVDVARRTFERARVTLAAAKSFGREVHVRDATDALRESARAYADAMRTHANIVMDLVAS